MSINTDQLIVCKCENCGENFKIKLKTYYQRKKNGHKPGRFCESCRGSSCQGLKSRIKTNAENSRYSYRWGD